MFYVANTDAPILHRLYEMWDSMIENVKKEIFQHEGNEEYEESPFSIFLIFFFSFRHFGTNKLISCTYLFVFN